MITGLASGQEAMEKKLIVGLEEVVCSLNSAARVCIDFDSIAGCTMIREGKELRTIPRTELMPVASLYFPRRPGGEKAALV